MAFNYRKLRGRIREVCGTQESFAEEMSISTASLSAKLNNRVEFTQTEISKAGEILGISPDEIPVYFFTPEVQQA